MKRFICAVVVMMFMAGVAAYAQEKRGTSEEAKAMVKKAVAYVKEVGREKALAEFSNPKGKFISKDLYISVLSMDGTLLAHPYATKGIGHNILNMKDADGKAAVKEKIENAKKNGYGIEVYRWSHPQTKKVEKKYGVYELVDNMVISCGYYK